MSNTMQSTLERLLDQAVAHNVGKTGREAAFNVRLIAHLRKRLEEAKAV